MNVYEKLNKARAEFHALELKKSGHNKFAGYYYFELGDFLIPALKVFADNGLCAIVRFEANEAQMMIKNVEKPDESIVITSPMGSAALKGCHEVQNIGAVETYQRRYLWVAALEIVEHDALDSSEPVKEQTAPKLSAKSVAAVEFESLPPEEQEFLQGIAMDVIALLDEGRDWQAKQLLESKNLDNDEKVAIWHLFNSKQRSSIKKAVSPEELATTP